MCAAARCAPQQRAEAAVAAALAKAAVKSAGNSLIGGDFELVDQDGKRFTSDQLKGAFSLLYFGFTFCPDICPDELVKMAETVDLVGTFFVCFAIDLLMLCHRETDGQACDARVYFNRPGARHGEANP